MPELETLWMMQNMRPSAVALQNSVKRSAMRSGSHAYFSERAYFL